MNSPFSPADLSPARPIDGMAPALPWLDRKHNALLLLGLLWLGYAAFWLFLSSGAIAAMDFRDPDDALRLVQVRDFLAGQGWLDVSQHRINPPLGGPMHWSRIVDLPLAAVILLLRPLTGQAAAELTACALVPLLTLGVIALGLFSALRRVMGNGAALLAVTMLGMSFPIIVQLTPMRIDHHGWQIAMAAWLLAGLLHPDPRKGGWIMGAAIALWLHISSEGLPYAAIAGGIVALRHAARADEWPRLIRYVSLLAGGSALLLLATHGWRGSLVSYCDAMSPVYLAPLLLLPPMMMLGRRLLGDGTAWRRLAPAMIAGVGAAGLFAATGGICLAGPFRTLSPTVYTLWYQGVLEGLPLWDQKLPLVLVILLPSLAGITGLALAAFTERDSGRRLQWLSLLGMMLGSFAVSLLVMRAMSVAHLMALAGMAWMIARLYPPIAARPNMLSRVVLTSSLVLLTPAGLALLTDPLLTLARPNAAAGPMENENERERQAAYSKQEIGKLAALSPAILFAPLDVGPEILVRTSHAVIGTGHHRNVVGIGKVIDAFIAPPDQARRIVLGTGAAYLLFAPKLGEIKRYAKYAPDGLAARLSRGEIPSWLSPAGPADANGMRLFRVAGSTAKAPPRR